MVGREDHFLEGSILGAPFWRWWNRASAGEAGVRPSEDQSLQIGKEEQLPKAAQEPFPSQELEDLIFITAVVPRPRPSSRSPSKSQPIDIPVKKVIPEQGHAYHPLCQGNMKLMMRHLKRCIDNLLQESSSATKQR